jgi:hypothetical protein
MSSPAAADLDSWAIVQLTRRGRDLATVKFNCTSIAAPGNRCFD